ncbi:hypothetical protein NEMBOFW57_002648 [Staphylotrichum longicolle]|uniref:Amidoligase enzyme n=1 Tax=Staphylotrichum longicolle TaxID=669026 RepID=A0AAD4F8E5_9PEZI|nr:hypothetical protein NEMBOFW57_002648 [Staphylotrichum longicolle]
MIKPDPTAARAAKNTPAPQKQATNRQHGELSFGIELEFLFYFKVPELLALHNDPSVTSDPDELTLSDADEARLPPALTLPPELAYTATSNDDAIDSRDTPRAWARDLLRAAIESVPGARMEGRPFPSASTATTTTASRVDDASHLGMYVVRDHDESHSGWAVKTDASVYDPEVEVRGYGVLGFEITSPALWDRPESHRHVHQVVRELTRRFRLRVGVRTGFHCHVGAGLEEEEEEEEEEVVVVAGKGKGKEKEKGKRGNETPPPPVHFWTGGSVVSELRGRKHELGVLRRAAALMWAADGFISHAHPPERGVNMYSLPIRHCSRLAHGVELRYVVNDEGNITTDEMPLEDAEYRPPIAAADLLPEQGLPSHGFPRVDSERLFPAQRNRELDAEARARYDVMTLRPQLEPYDSLVNRTVRRGVAHILACRSRTEIAQLLHHPTAMYYDRLNYNLKQYLGPQYNANSDSTGTVEFREAAGTMSPEWVSAWSNICLGFFRFAREASDAQFWTVIEKLAKAEAAAQARTPKKHTYDMISLLFDMGLFAEALFLERNLRQDPVRFWYPNRISVRPPSEDGGHDGEYEYSAEGWGASVDNGEASGINRDNRWNTGHDHRPSNGPSLPSAASSPFLDHPTPEDWTTGLWRPPHAPRRQARG